jgi:enoyl-[acyl-carrier protein] reductase I
MALFTGKKGLILGVANNFSIAWHIAKAIMDQEGVCGFSHLPDKPDDERKKMRMRVAKCIETYPNNSKFLMPLDVQKDEDIAAIMAKAKEEFGTIDFLLHSIAFASLEDL